VRLVIAFPISEAEMKRGVVFGVVGCLAFLFVLAAVGAGGAYWYYTRTPDYSLRQIGHALKTHDTTLFEKHVDVDAVCNAAVDAFLADTRGDVPRDKWEAAGQGVGNAIVNLLRPQIVAKARREIAKAIERGGSVEGRRYALRTGAIARDGAVATADLWLDEKDAPSRANSVRLALRLRDKGGYWQVFEISNLDELIREGRLANLRR
jgi:hypothetical protein